MDEKTFRKILKDELKNFITKDDAKAFATKDDLKELVTKKDLKDTEERLTAVIEREVESLGEIINNFTEQLDDKKIDKSAWHN